MTILCIRTDSDQAEVSVFYNKQEVASISWEAGRALSDTIHQKIEEILEIQAKTWDDIEGVVCYAGPGSFTGLRIGAAVANTLASSLDIPIVSYSGADWKLTGIAALLAGDDKKIIVPVYGSEPKTTKPRK